jgi:hypothetical protein
MDQFIHEIKTFEDACRVEGLDIEEVNANIATVPAGDRRSELDRISMVAYAKLLIIARAINRLANGGNSWLPDWSNYEQYKYYPYFEMRGSSGFRFGDYDHWRSRSRVGSRLCFISYEAAEHAGKQFQDLYKEFMVIE